MHYCLCSLCGATFVPSEVRSAHDDTIKTSTDVVCGQNCTWSFWLSDFRFWVFVLISVLALFVRQHEAQNSQAGWAECGAIPCNAHQRALTRGSESPGKSLRTARRAELHSDIGEERRCRCNGDSHLDEPSMVMPTLVFIQKLDSRWQVCVCVCACVTRTKPQFFQTTAPWSSWWFEKPCKRPKHSTQTQRPEHSNLNTVTQTEQPKHSDQNTNNLSTNHQFQ